MNIEDLTVKSYLDELYRLTGGDPEAQVSMYDVGAAIGLDKTEAGSLAEQLMVEGLAELRTLAGGIAITAAGLSVLGFANGAATTSTDTFQLGTDRVITETDRQVIVQLTDEIKAELGGQQFDYRAMEEMVIDLKTIEVQLLSPQPKTAIFKEVFRSLQSVLEGAGVTQTAQKISSITTT